MGHCHKVRENRERERERERERFATVLSVGKYLIINKKSNTFPVNARVLPSIEFLS